MNKKSDFVIIRSVVISAGAALILAAAGCSKDESLAELPASNPADSSMSGLSSALADETAAAPAAAAATTTASDTPFTTGVLAQTASPEGLPTVDDNGRHLDTLAGLQRAVEYYERVIATRVAQSEEEEKIFKPAPRLTSLQQLVQFRVIKAVPAAPSGMQYVLDPQTRQVKLTNL
jgi:hypothetical protein